MNLPPRVVAWGLVCTMGLGLLFQDAARSNEANTPESFDLVVVEATPAGIAMAVRAAREGLHVLLVNRTQHLGGILSSGLSVWDTLHEGKRSPIYDEVRQAIFDHYRTTYGDKSPQYRDCLPGPSGHTNGRFEPHVAERILTALVASEKSITVLKGFIPVAVERDGALLKSIEFREFRGTATRRCTAAVFADCTYEGDLLPLAGVPYRVGREGRSEYLEPRAGVVYSARAELPPSEQAARFAKEHDLLKLRKFPGFQKLLPESTGASDGNVQAYNYRTLLTTDPKLRLPVVKPKPYDPAFLKKLDYGSIVAPLPNDTIGWNRPQLIDRQTDYVEGTWKERLAIMDAHWKATLDLLWFLQNDPSVPEARRKHWQQYGVTRNEYADNGHRPYEIYVREARRLLGRTIYTQHDATLAPDLRRAPLHTDSVGITEWSLDSHACTPRRVPGGEDEGRMALHQETFPGQLPYAALLPQGVDNLLVPVCLSATHVAWGTVRLEPTWMNLAESAAFAVVQAQQEKRPPARIDTDRLLKTLALRRVMISFFNDLDIVSKEAWIVPAQYFGTKGFFDDYNVRADKPLRAATGRIWIEAMAKSRRGEPDANATARAVSAAEAENGPALGGDELAKLLSLPRKELPEAITRGVVLELLWRQVAAGR